MSVPRKVNNGAALPETRGQVVLPSYPSAREAALRVLPHLAQHVAAARGDRDAEVTILPDYETAEAMLDVAFWASLRREEGYIPRISLAYVSPDQVSLPLTFERPLPLTARGLVKLAPAVERPGIHLGISRNGGGLCVWGATRKLPAFCFVIEVVAPGVLVIKHSRGEESGKFLNIAVLEGDQIKVIDQEAATTPDCPDLLTSLLGLESQFASIHSVNVLIQLAVSMRQHGRGGLLLVVPSGSEVWQESILRPIMYAVLPAYSSLADLMRAEPEERPERQWQDALRRAVDGIGGLTAVDGATIINDQHQLLAFGAKIVRRSRWPQVDRVIVTEPIEGVAPAIQEPAQLGGTRHLSAAQFAHDQRDAIALVASQDGRFTVFGWSPCEQMVHAHRIETLLL
jgi:hypothetical protein